MLISVALVRGSYGRLCYDSVVSDFRMLSQQCYSLKGYINKIIALPLDSFVLLLKLAVCCMISFSGISIPETIVYRYFASGRRFTCSDLFL